MELMEYIFIPDQGKWRGGLKGSPDDHAYGDSFEELQAKLHQLQLGQSRSSFSSTCADTTLVCSHQQRGISGIHNERSKDDGGC